MRKALSISLAVLFISTASTGCFISHKTETVREVPRTSSTTIERNSTVETVPSDEAHTHTTVRTY